MLNFKEQAYMCEWIMGVFLILQELFLQGKDERGGVEEKGNDTRLEKKVPSKKKKKTKS